MEGTTRKAQSRSRINIFGIVATGITVTGITVSSLADFAPTALINVRHVACLCEAGIVRLLAFAKCREI